MSPATSGTVVRLRRISLLVNDYCVQRCVRHRLDTGASCVARIGVRVPAARPGESTLGSRRRVWDGEVGGSSGDKPPEPTLTSWYRCP